MSTAGDVSKVGASSPMLNWSLRYLPVADIVRSIAPESVLDVGSGWHGLSTFWRGCVVQTDLHFDGEPPVGPIPGTVTYVAADAMALPFSDCSFEVVVSLDLIEHLPVELRPAAIRELTRVAARTLVVACPANEAAARTDRRLAKGLAWLKRTPPPWLEEHLAQSWYPDDRTIENAMPNGWRISERCGLGNAALTWAVVMGEHLPVLHRGMRVLGRWYAGSGPYQLADWGVTYRRLWRLERE